MQKPFGSENFISLVPRPFPPPIFDGFQYTNMDGNISLVPRPFPPPIFDGFQYTNMDGNEAKKSLCVPIG